MCVSQGSTSTLSPDSSQDAQVPGFSLAQLWELPSAHGGTRRSLANARVSPGFWPQVLAYLTLPLFLAPSPSYLVFRVVAKSLHLDSHENHLPLVQGQAPRGQGRVPCRHLCSPRPATPQPLGKYLFNKSTHKGLLSKVHLNLSSSICWIRTNKWKTNNSIY